MLGTGFDEALKTIRKSPVLDWEIFDDGSHTLNPRRVSKLRRLSAEKGVSYTVHGPMSDLNLASLNGEASALALRRLKRSLTYSSSLEAMTWVLHPGTHGALSWIRPSDDWKVNRSRLELMQRMAKRLQVPLAIENISLGSAILRRVEDFLRLYEDWQAAPRMCLDIGHSHINLETDDFLKKLGNRIGHVHAHDNRGGLDRHLAVGTGTIHWKKTLASLVRTGYSKRVIVESVKGPFASYKKVRDLLRSLQ